MFDNLAMNAPDLDADAHVRRAWTEEVVERVLEHIEGLTEAPAQGLEGAEAAAARIPRQLPQVPSDLPSVLRHVLEATPFSLNTAGPGYLAYIPGGGLYSAALADFVACSINRYVGVWQAAPALVELERIALEWCAELIDWPRSAAGVFTSGGSISNLIALVTAREALLGEDLPRGRIYFSAATHHCVAKAARFAGFSKRSLVSLPLDPLGRIDAEQLDAAIERDRRAGFKPFLVVGNAGTTDTGSIDPLADLADICQKHGLWFHVDGAYGGLFRMVPEMKDRLAGIERADSVTLDPHKGLFLPYGTGCLLVKERKHLERANVGDAAYLQDLEQPDRPVHFADLSPELSRDFRGLRVWLPLMLHGADAFRANLREKHELAVWTHTQLSELPELEVGPTPELSVLWFRCRGVTLAEANEATRSLLQRLNAEQRVFLSSTTLDGHFTARICVLSFRTHLERMQEAVESIRRLVRS